MIGNADYQLAVLPGEFGVACKPKVIAWFPNALGNGLAQCRHNVTLALGQGIPRRAACPRWSKESWTQGSRARGQEGCLPPGSRSRRDMILMKGGPPLLAESNGGHDRAVRGYPKGRHLRHFADQGGGAIHQASQWITCSHALRCSVPEGEVNLSLIHQLEAESSIHLPGGSVTAVHRKRQLRRAGLDGLPQRFPG